ncbi:MAG: hypothetical protein AAGI37_05090 [Planctomycetota bacterium]
MEIPSNSSGFRIFAEVRLLAISGAFVQLLRRILRRLSTAVDRPLEVLISKLKVVCRRHRLAVTDPFADDVNRELLGQLRLAGAA